MKLAVRVFLVWLAIMACETVNGICRELFITPRVGDTVARRISFGVALVLIMLVAVLSARYFAELTNVGRMIVGSFWAVLTFFFEAIIVAKLAGIPWERVIADYDPSQGGLMGFGLVYLAAAPSLGNELWSILRRKEPSQ